jgi:hypothetical protein
MYIIHEAITKDNIDSLHKDYLIFLKNIQRVKTWVQY